MEVDIDVGVLVGTGLALGLIFFFCIGGWITESKDKLRLINYWHDVIRANEGCIKEYLGELYETRQELAESKQNAITLQSQLAGLRNEYNKAVAGEQGNNESVHRLEGELTKERNKNNDLTTRIESLEWYLQAIAESCKDAKKHNNIPF